ncbi:HAD-IA family hydrolase [Amycolatopsis cihanbeyliensis]|uniref:HAD-IA family hydrolase n=1 Tax=Amycolatopsis cihanbeyliensis TaxID=1128664 RepID=UPI001150D968|nr:HAD-IA family hydrolase [Amycolatopsis cihanbeyliensis]
MLRGLVLDYAGVLTDTAGGNLLLAVEAARDQGVRTALLSNAAGGGAARRAMRPYFDAVVFSGEVGVAKPEAEVYRITADLLGLPAQTCVFVDDSASNVAGAVAAGMVGVHHTSVQETRTELAALFPGILDT